MTYMFAPWYFLDLREIQNITELLFIAWCCASTCLKRDFSVTYFRDSIKTQLDLGKYNFSRSDRWKFLLVNFGFRNLYAGKQV